MMAMTTNPVLLAKLLASVFIVSGLFCSGWHYGSKHVKNDWDKEKNAQVLTTHKEYLKQTETLNVLASDLEKAKNAQHIKYVTITKNVDRIVERAVYRTDCIDDDGLRNINSAIAGTPADTGIPDAAMPTSATTVR